eukprot:15188-Heterococcus_DN1.PRE.5
MILHTHRLLMQGQDDSAGSFRSRPKISELGWIYIDAESVPLAVQHEVQVFNAATASTGTAAALHPVQRTAELYCAMMAMIYPITEDNSVLCSLLASYAFMSSSDAPFCVPLLTEHGKSGSSLAKCVRRVQRRRGSDEHALNRYFALCYARSLSAFTGAVASSDSSA